MAFDAFLMFFGDAVGTGSGLKIVGESTDSRHKDAIPVTAFEFGVTNKATISSASTGAGAGKATFEVFKIRKAVDLASPGLFAVSASGGHFNEARLYIRKAGGAAGDFLTYSFKMVFINSINWSGSSGDELPEETVEFAYGALQVGYAQQNSSGQLTQPKVQAWSVVNNRADFSVPGVPNTP